MKMSRQAKPDVLHYQVLSKNVLTPDEADLYELCNLAGIVFDPNVFRIIVDLLRFNIAPTAIERMLKSIVSKQKRKQTVEGIENMSEPSLFQRTKPKMPAGPRSKTYQSMK